MGADLYEVIRFYNIPNPSTHNGPGVIQPVTEMNTRDLNKGKGLPARIVDNLTCLSTNCLEQWQSTFFVRIPPDIPPKLLVCNSSYTQSIIYI
jgi:hypothetical protein